MISSPKLEKCDLCPTTGTWKPGLCETNLMSLLASGGDGSATRAAPQADSRLGDAVHDPVGGLVADLPGAFGQPLGCLLVGTGRLPVLQQRGGAAGQGLVLDAVQVHDEGPAAVLLERGREVVPVLLDHDGDLVAVDAGHEGIHLQTGDGLVRRPPRRALAAPVEL